MQMESKKSHIGLVIEDNFITADLNIRAYERLAVKLNPLATAYELLGLGKFSKEVLADLIKNKTKSIQERIVKEVESQLKSSGVTLPALVESQKENALKTIFPFAEMLKSFLSLYDLESSRDRIQLDIMSVVNANGRLVIDRKLKEHVKNLFEIKIETEEQSEFYQQFLELKNKFESFMSIAKELTVIQQEMSYYENNSIIYLDQKGAVYLNPHVIQEMKSKK